MTATGPARLLPQRLELFDVPDVEDVARHVLKGYCTKSGARLALADQEDCVAFLVSEAWIISERFDASRGAPFSAILRGRLSFRCTDWMRVRLGRSTWKFSTHTYTRERPVPLSLDSGAPGDGESLGETLEGSSGHLAAASDATTRGLLAETTRFADDDQRVLREGAARIIAARAARSREQQRQKQAIDTGSARA